MNIFKTYEMANSPETTICGWCKIHTHMTRIGLCDSMRYGQPVVHQIDLNNGWTALDEVFECDNCKRLSIRTTTYPTDIDIEDAIAEGAARRGSDGKIELVEDDLSPAEDVDDWSPSTRWYLLPTMEEKFPDVPDAVAAAATEATLCLSVGAYRATSVLARAVLEAIGKDQGFTMQGIKPKIEAMFEAGLIRQKIADAATVVRDLGNDMAHGDFIDPVTEEEAKRAIALMKMVLQEVYQEDALIKDGQVDNAARENQKKA